MSTLKKIIIIAGPNGAGKTTFARSFLPFEAQCPRFINADLIAAGIAPFAPEKASIAAARIMLEMMREQVQAGNSFAFETTLSGTAYARAIPKWRALGYYVELFFLALPSPEYAIERVRKRVEQGGHHIPEDLILRRFFAGLHNFEYVYKPLVDVWTHIENSKDNELDWSEHE